MLLKIPCSEICIYSKHHLLIRFMFLCINSYLSCLKASAFTSGVSTECSKSAPSGPAKKRKILYCRSSKVRKIAIGIYMATLISEMKVRKQILTIKKTIKIY